MARKPQNCRDRRAYAEKHVYEERMKEAIDAVNVGTHTAGAASKEFKVSEQTLRDRHTGRHAAWHEAASKQQKLSPAQEATLVEWVIHQTAAGNPVDCAQIIAYAAQLVPNKKIGKNWLEQFPDGEPSEASVTIESLVDDSDNDDLDDDFVPPELNEEGTSQAPRLGEEVNYPDMEDTVGGDMHRDGAPIGYLTRSRSILTRPELEKLGETVGKFANVPMPADEAKSHEELLSDIRKLQGTVSMLAEAVHSQEAQIHAANSHCTIIKRQLELSQIRLQNTKKKKERGSTKIKARFITLPSLKAAFYAEDAMRAEKERQEVIRLTEKEAHDVLIEQRITEESASRVFTSLTSYKTKFDLCMLARALHLNDVATNTALIDQIRAHLKENETELKKNPRFQGLF
ncbi:hypothetical protein D9756_006480 [Leucocoprinus leucothites]|uniref:HTH CENPB-type domain-containing protein n=1 Tax=Leucocoprinus leucothites TaxID=201217 RepID=A0A8H5LGX4_9AGAR|nr:hypothetical protein D9756_006480 [Leucoagaricus leucothites]